MVQLIRVAPLIAPVPRNRRQKLSGPAATGSPQQSAEKVVDAQLACLPAEVVQVERLAVGGQDRRRFVRIEPSGEMT
jgi:hypothetical protein